MPRITSDYTPPWYLRNGHLNTLYPYLYRKQDNPGYSRSRWRTYDDDFIDLDFIRQQSSTLVILSHGLEGSSSSQYMIAAARHLAGLGHDICALNYRSCSGDMNRTTTMYHSGFTYDLHMIIQRIASDYRSVYLVGFSLGGNMNLKYSTDGIYTLHPHIRAVISVSAPIDLSASSHRISSWYNYHYQYNFLSSLLEKMEEKSKMHPGEISIGNKKRVKTLIDFDEYFTGPLHGFSGAEDYYSQCNALQFLDHVRIPTLIISAQDDPFLTESCIPYHHAAQNAFIHLLAPKYGGHVGFTSSGTSVYWIEKKIGEFISQQEQQHKSIVAI